MISGVMWERIGTVELAGGLTELWVELSTDAVDGYVHADAVWAGRSTTPELVVQQGGTNLIDELSTVDFGYSELFPTTPQTRQFTVRNVGGADLTLFEPINVPLGFTLVETTDDLDILDGLLDGKVTLQPAGSAGSSFDFTVRVDAAAPGDAGGKVTFFSDDAEADPFEFGLAAQIGLQTVVARHRHQGQVDTEAATVDAVNRSG